MQRKLTVAGPALAAMMVLSGPVQADEVIIGEYNATYKKFYQRLHHKDESRNYTVRLLFKCKITGMDSMKDPTGSDAKQ